METELKWKKGVPAEVGLHFVAIKLGEAAGVYDFLVWNGDAWEGLEHGTILAFVDIEEFKRSLRIKWPESDSVEYTPKNLPGDDSVLWKEV